MSILINFLKRIKNKPLFLITILILYSVSSFAQKKLLTWDFPLSAPFDGMQIGNSTQGLMIWGKDNQLNVTIGHNGFWFHGGYTTLDSLTSFKEIKSMLYARDTVNDSKEFWAKFGKTENTTRFPRPWQLGGGRLEITLPAGYKLQEGVLDIHQATAHVYVSNSSGERKEIMIRQLMRSYEKVQLAWISFPKGMKPVCKLIPSWHWTKIEMEQMGIKPPGDWENADGGKGFIQALPEDLPLGIGYKETNDKILIGSYLGEASREMLSNQLFTDTIKKYLPSTQRWWQKYWATVPKINLPDPILQGIVDYGLYEQACITNPLAKPSGLQGPFLESYQLPPWGDDFHFNVNVQMIYSPVLASNRPDHFKPLWEMINSWLPAFREKGEQLYGQKNAVLFPHAVDNRGHVRGNFWTGIVDQACAAWMGFMAWKDYRYTIDENVLSNTAWPLLEGAFEAYWATLEKIDDSNAQNGYRYSLPVSVSPEYGRAYSAYQWAWGRDASYQLAVLHRVARILPEAAALLGKPVDPRWRDVEQHLPPYSSINTMWMPEDRTNGIRIALWEGQDLDGSQRHQSHLAGIYPFCTINPKDKNIQDVLSNTIRNWVFKGAGNWMGWSCPWAAEIWSRLGDPDAAISWLHYWAANYVSKGRSSMAFICHPGQSLIADYRWPNRIKNSSLHEKMQMDAAMGALNAVFELLVQNHIDSGVVTVLPAIPRGWEDFSFKGMRTIGAFLVSATVKEGQTKSIKITSTKGGLLKLEHGLGITYELNGKTVHSANPVLQIETKPGEVITLERIGKN